MLFPGKEFLCFAVSSPGGNGDQGAQGLFCWYSNISPCWRGTGVLFALIFGEMEEKSGCNTDLEQV